MNDNLPTDPACFVWPGDSSSDAPEVDDLDVFGRWAPHAGEDSNGTPALGPSVCPWCGVTAGTIHESSCRYG